MVLVGRPVVRGLLSFFPAQVVSELSSFRAGLCPMLFALTEKARAFVAVRLSSGRGRLRSLSEFGAFLAEFPLSRWMPKGAFFSSRTSSGRLELTAVLLVRGGNVVRGIGGPLDLGEFREASALKRAVLWRHADQA